MTDDSDWIMKVLREHRLMFYGIWAQCSCLGWKISAEDVGDDVWDERHERHVSEKLKERLNSALHPVLRNVLYDVADNLPVARPGQSQHGSAVWIRRRADALYGPQEPEGVKE